MTTRVKVLYVAGMPHSGSTIVSRILGDIPGFASVGELYYLWDAWTKGLPCGCGKPLAQCPFWSATVAAAMKQSGGTMEDLRPDRYYMALQQLPAVMLGRQGVPPRPYTRGLQAVLGAIAEVGDARVIVDASKSPTVGRIVDSLAGSDVYVLHLVRAPQAVSNSWSQFAGEEGRAARHASVWNAWNAAIEALWARRRGRYLRVRYEDFSQHPRETMASVARFVGESLAALPFVSDHVVRLGVTHTVAGNAVRFQTGDVEIRLDGRWLDAYPERNRRVVAALTWPMRTRYGYR
jgi:hypothetical protein